MVSTKAVFAALTFFATAALADVTAGAPSRPPLPPEMRGDIMMARKMYREAIDFYSQVPDSSASRWNKTGIAYHQLLDLTDARKNYEHAIRVDSNCGEARNNLGTVFYSLKSYRRAIREYKKALRIMPESASVLSNLGTAYFARKDYKKASEAYQMALHLDPDVFERHSSFGVLMQEHTVTERAKFHYYLAKLYAKQGSEERAMQYVRKALEEGFKDRQKFVEEPEFATLQKNAEFLEIMKSDPRVL